MKRFIILILLLVISGSAMADKFMVPHSCYPQKIVRKFAEYGLKLELSGEYRDKDSWGYLINEGNKFTIYTYYSVTEEERLMLLEILNRDWSLEYEEGVKDG